jgi:cytochrome oxidase Cu insertion factor (SCO1/SenC/PrrC family)
VTESEQPARRTGWLLWCGLALTAATLFLAFLLAFIKTRPALKPLPIYGQAADFTLTNQDGRAISLGDLRGHVWVADVIFTRCAGPCLKMTQQMKELQEALPATSQARLVTLTTDPEFDTPPLLKARANQFRADPNRWLFLTGRKKQLMDLATGSLKLTAIENAPDKRESPADLFIHSTIFVVMDKQARLRGIFETTGDGVDPQQTQAEILAALRRLERER